MPPARDNPIIVGFISEDATHTLLRALVEKDEPRVPDSAKERPLRSCQDVRISQVG